MPCCVPGTLGWSVISTFKTRCPGQVSVTDELRCTGRACSRVNIGLKPRPNDRDASPTRRCNSLKYHPRPFTGLTHIVTGVTLATVPITGTKPRPSSGQQMSHTTTGCCISSFHGDYTFFD